MRVFLPPPIGMSQNIFLRGLALIRDGGWPTCGSDIVIFFHRNVDREAYDGKVKITWGVFRYNIGTNTAD